MPLLALSPLLLAIVDESADGSRLAEFASQSQGIAIHECQLSVDMNDTRMCIESAMDVKKRGRGFRFRLSCGAGRGLPLLIH